jgi:outer membrane immunogenic protein
MSKIQLAAVGILGVAVLSAGAAVAQDTPWNGFYVGVNAGGSKSDTHMDMKAASGTGAIIMPPGDVALVNAIGSTKDNDTGFTGGVQGGYNYQVDSWVFGLETDVGFYDLGQSRSKSFQSPLLVSPPITFTIQQRVKTDWIWTLRPRIGYASDTWMFYGTAGVAVSEIKLTTSYSDTRATPITASNKESDTKTGWTAGLGGAYALSPNISIRGEWLYTNLGTVKSQTTVGSNYATLSSEADTRGNLIRLGLDYRF